MLKHSFSDYKKWFDHVNDPRIQSKIYYQKQSLLWNGLFNFIFKLGSNRGFYYHMKDKETGKFKMTGLENFKIITNDSQIEKIPHPDTPKLFFNRIEPLEIEKVGINMTRELIRRKTFNNCRFLNQYFLLVIDGTQQAHFDSPHCPFCLTTKHKSGKITYHHNLLVAKFVFSNGITLPVATEFIENGKTYNKQDCETKAAYRLLDRIKKYLPQLKICLVGDSLYVNRKIIKKCTDYKWPFIITLKEGSAKSLFADYEDFKKIDFISKEEYKIKSGNAQQKVYYKNNLDFTSGKVNIVECIETVKKQKTRFVYVTNIYSNHENIFEILNKGGRQRSKIENEGFNEEKNGGYNLEHLFCKELVAMKNYVYLLQIAHSLNQLFERGLFKKDDVKKLFGGYKYITHELLVDFLLGKIISHDIKKFNFNFDTS